MRSADVLLAWLDGPVIDDVPAVDTHVDHPVDDWSHSVPEAHQLDVHDAGFDIFD